MQLCFATVIAGFAVLNNSIYAAQHGEPSYMSGAALIVALLLAATARTR